MDYSVGTMFCVDKVKQQYAMIVRKSDGIPPEYTFAYMTEAKSYEHPSVLCVQTHKSRNFIYGSNRWFCMSGNLLFKKTRDAIIMYGSPVGNVSEKSIAQFISTIDNKNLFTQAWLALASIRDNYRKKQELKEKEKQETKARKKGIRGKCKVPGMSKRRSLYTGSSSKRPFQGSGFSPK